MTFSPSTASHSPSRRGGQSAVVQRMFAAIACAALVLGGCASTTEILRSSNEAIPAKPIRTLFVAGVSTDDEMRQRYENVFVAELAKDGIKGIPTLQIFKAGSMEAQKVGAVPKSQLKAFIDSVL